MAGKGCIKRNADIRGWLTANGVPDSDLQDEIIINFCGMNQYKRITCSLTEMEDKILFAWKQPRLFKEWTRANYNILNLKA